MKTGELYAIVGSVGAGKVHLWLPNKAQHILKTYYHYEFSLTLETNFQSSFLQAILGELKPLTGQIYVSGKVSYASQEPWLFAGSVRSNILFGQPYDKDRYQKVINVCALVKDLEQFPYGDKTLVGDRGTALSGGQRARINLAR